MRTTTTLLVLALLTIGCRGEEVARVKLSAKGDSGDASWKGGKVKVWADYQGEWKGGQKNPGLEYAVEVKEGSTSVATATCKTSTCSSSVCSSTTQINDEVKGNCECLMDCTIDVPEGKDYTVSAKLTDAKGDFKNASLVLRK